jgi:hypothetical protein
MELQIWTMNQLTELEKLVKRKILPAEVLERVREIVTTLDNAYGIERDVQGKNSSQEGGYVLISTNPIKSRMAEILQKVKVHRNEFEYEEFIDDGKQKWRQRLYLIDNDYGIVFVYPIEEEETV